MEKIRLEDKIRVLEIIMPSIKIENRGDIKIFEELYRKTISLLSEFSQDK